VTFTGETGSGWQQASFASPVAIQANTVYVASYFAPNGHYSGNLNYFATQGFDAPPLHALATGVAGGNGVSSYRGGGTDPGQHVPGHQLLGGCALQRTTGSDADVDRGHSGQRDTDRWSDAAVHGHRDVLRLEHAEPDQPGDVGVLEHGGGDDRLDRARDRGGGREHDDLGDARRGERQHGAQHHGQLLHDDDLAEQPDAGHRRRRRHPPGGAGREVPVRRGGLHQGCPLLQSRDQHRNARRHALVGHGPEPRDGDLHGRDGLGLA